MGLLVKDDVPPDPVHIRVLGPAAVMTRTDRVAHAIEELGLRSHSGRTGEHRANGSVASAENTADDVAVSATLGSSVMAGNARELCACQAEARSKLSSEGWDSALIVVRNRKGRDPSTTANRNQLPQLAEGLAAHVAINHPITQSPDHPITRSPDPHKGALAGSRRRCLALRPPV
jgi:hypothetical protein